jgi:hypothetical protein
MTRISRSLPGVVSPQPKLRKTSRRETPYRSQSSGGDSGQHEGLAMHTRSRRPPRCFRAPESNPSLTSADLSTREGESSRGLRSIDESNRHGCSRTPRSCSPKPRAPEERAPRRNPRNHGAFRDRGERPSRRPSRKPTDPREFAEVGKAPRVGRIQIILKRVIHRREPFCCGLTAQIATRTGRLAVAHP